jgi:peptidoglycan/LPS O-acetylase OafA/YrhL
MKPPEFERAAVVPRFDGIDLLRGVSILSVILLHVSLFLSFHGVQFGAGFPEWLGVVLLRNGNGVATFFAVSGFLITLTSIRRFGSLRRVRPAVFYRIRFARIAPPLALVLAILSVLHLAHVPMFRIDPRVAGLGRAVFAAVTFHLNWLEAARGWLPPCWTVLWSLSVEEMFYLCFPLLCVVLLRRAWGWSVFAVILGGLVVLGPLARSVFTANPIWADESYLAGMDGIALGCLCAVVAERCSKNLRFVRSRWPLMLQVVGVLTMLFIEEWVRPRTLFGWPVKRAMGRSGTDITVLIFGTCLVMLGSVMRQGRGRVWTAPIRWFGRYSYEIYLTHEFVVLGVSALLLKVHGGPLGVWVGLILALSAGVGFLTARFVSEPLNRALRGARLPYELDSELGPSVLPADVALE